MAAWCGVAWVGAWPDGRGRHVPARRTAFVLQVPLPAAERLHWRSRWHTRSRQRRRQWPWRAGWSRPQGTAPLGGRAWGLRLPVAGQADQDPALAPAPRLSPDYHLCL